MLQRLSALLVLCSGMFAPLSAADPTALRDALHGRWLESREAERAREPDRDLCLRLEGALRYHGTKVRHTSDQSGVEFEHVDVLLRRQGGRWLSDGLAGLSDGLRDRLVVEDIVTDELQWTGDALAGSLGLSTWRYRHRQDMHGAIVYHHLPPEAMPVPDWQLGGAWRTRPFTQVYRLDFPSGGSELWTLRLDLIDGIDLRRPPASDAQLAAAAEEAVEEQVARQLAKGRTVDEAQRARMLRDRLASLEEKRAKQAADRGYRQVEVFARFRDGHLLEGWALSPGWNKAGHDLDVSGLQADEQGVHGELVVHFRPDRWVGGNQPVQRYRLALSIDEQGLLVGSCTASGDFGSYPVRCRGRLGRSRLGSYQFDGPDGTGTGRAFLELRPPAGRTVLPALAAADPVQDALEAHRQARAVLAALQPERPPLARCLEERRLVALPPAAPEATTTGLQWLGDALAAQAAAAPPLVGLQLAADLAFGPGYGAAAPLPSSGAAALLPAIDPAAPQSWSFVTTWRRLGPIAGRPREAETAAILPPVAGWRLPGAEQSWVPCQPFSTCYALPEAIAETATGLDAFHWFAATELESPVAQEVWVALPAHSDGLLWHDGVPVWRGHERADGLQTSLVRLHLAAGRNSIVLRAGIDGLGWQAGMGSVVVNGAGKLPHAGTGLLVCTAGAPGTAAPTDESVLAVAQPSADPGSPPIAWSIAGDVNRRWSAELAADARQPELLGTDVLVVDGRGLQLHALSDGSLRWRRELPGLWSHPAVAGERIVLHDGAGRVLCLAADGATCWERAAGPSWAGRQVDAGLMMSAAEIPRPVVVGDTLVLAVVDQEEVPSVDKNGEPTMRKRPIRRLVALALDDGAPRWQRTLPGDGPGLVALRLRRGMAERLLLATARGELLDAVTGELLFSDLTGMVDGAAVPTVVADRLIWCGGGGEDWIGGWAAGWKACSSVWLDASGRVGRRFLWRSKGPSRYAGPPGVVYGGRFLVPRCNSGHHQEGPAPYSKLHVIDPLTGTLLGDVNPLLDQGTAPTDLTVADGRLYSADAGGIQYFNRNELARIAVLAGDDIPLVIAENPVPAGPHRPLYRDSCIVVAGEGQLHCLAVDEAAGERWQYERMAEQVIARLGTQPTDPTERLREIAALDAEPDRSRMVVVPFRHRSLPEHMLMLGPFPQELPESTWLPFATANTVAALPTLGQALPGLPDLHFHPATAGSLRYAGPNWSACGNEWVYRASWLLDCWAAVGRQQERGALFTAVYEVLREGTWRFQSQAAGVRAWLGGTELIDGDVVTLRPGFHPIAVAFTIGKVPAFLRDRQIVAAVAFSRWLDVPERRTRWSEKLGHHRGVIGQVLAAIPDSPLAGQLQAMLSAAR